MRDFDPTALAYVGHLQTNIGRMHEASKSCKNFCIALVSAIVTSAVAAKNGHIAYVGLLPTVVFFFLDAYYLSLERDFISLHSRFVAKYLENDDAVPFDLNPSFEGPSRPVGTVKAVISFSVWPFYLIALIGCIWAGGSL